MRRQADARRPDGDADDDQDRERAAGPEPDNQPGEDDGAQAVRVHAVRPEQQVDVGGGANGGVQH